MLIDLEALGQFGGEFAGFLTGEEVLGLAGTCTPDVEVVGVPPPVLMYDWYVSFPCRQAPNASAHREPPYRDPSAFAEPPPGGDAVQRNVGQQPITSCTPAHVRVPCMLPFSDLCPR
jgi:hypothetical protein